MKLIEIKACLQERKIDKILLTSDIVNFLCLENLIYAVRKRMKNSVLHQAVTQSSYRIFNVFLWPNIHNMQFTIS